MDDLSTGRVWLDAYRDDDEAVFVEWCADVPSYAFLRKSCPQSESPHQLFQYLATVSRTARRDNRVWTVRRAGNIAVGHIELKCTDKTGPTEREAILLIAPGHRGNGYGGDAIGALIEQTNTVGGCNVVLAVCRPTNEASVHIVGKFGFRLARQEPDAL
jgi:RimJ/RimL family protein N-acetyltransferase